MPLRTIPPEDFRPLFESSMNAVFLTISDGSIVATNSAACKMFGMTEAELCAAGRTSLVDADDPAFSTSLLEPKRLGTGRAEVIYRRKGGSRFIGETSSVLLADGQKAFVIIRDISDRKRLETERDHLMNELEAIIAFLPEGLVLCGPDGEILRLNPAAEAMLGYPPEVQGKPLKERYTFGSYMTPLGKTIPVESLPLARALRGETVQMEKIGYTRPDGKFLWLSVSAAPIYSADGRLQGVVAIDSNITRLHQLQEEKEGYLHTITHDLRNPLTVIRGHSDLLRNEIEKAGLGELPHMNIESIQIACGQMVEMMNELSEMARLEGGRLKTRQEAIDFPRFLADYLRRTQVVVDISRINSEIPSGLPPVWVDHRCLERCLDNLVGNALKYAEGDAPIRLSAERQGNELVISVADRGPGILPDDLPHVFERFFRARNVEKQGLGLGLFITRSLTEANGGRVWVESEPDRGSTFHLALPLAEN
jgi:PAS domain S-box-containing protein